MKADRTAMTLFQEARPPSLAPQLPPRENRRRAHQTSAPSRQPPCQSCPSPASLLEVSRD